MNNPSSTMPVSDNFWAMSNAQPNELLVWLEPWAEEFQVPSRSSIFFEIDSTGKRTETLEVDVKGYSVVVWARFGELVNVSIDGVLQHSASAQIVFPEIPNLSPKDVLELLFKDHPPARLGGGASEDDASEPDSPKSGVA